MKLEFLGTGPKNPIINKNAFLAWDGLKIQLPF